MTKKFFIFLIGFVFLGLIAFAQTPQENFEKAGQVELAKRNEVLLAKEFEIKWFFDEMGADAVISSKEMVTLQNVVSNFARMQIAFDKELEFYGRTTSVEVPSIILNLLNIYFKINQKESAETLNCTDNESQDIRKYFTEKTGRDIQVEKSKDYGSRVAIGLLVGFIAAGVVLVLIVCIFDLGGILTACLVLPVFALVVIAFLFWF